LGAFADGVFADEALGVDEKDIDVVVPAGGDKAVWGNSSAVLDGFGLEAP
jgi:hypothetical protein